MMKRIFSLILSIAMMLTMLPAQALAVVFSEVTEAAFVPVETEETAQPAAEPSETTEPAVTELQVQETIVQENTSAAEGTAGDALTWSLDDAGTLTISGTGTMTDYSYFSPAPWKASSGSVLKVVIEEGVTSIGSYAFSACNKMKEASIPSTVTAIGNDAFSNCNVLASLTLPEGLTTIGANAFEYCNALTEIMIPDSVTVLGERAFYYCQGLQKATIGSGVAQLPNYLFYGCGKLTEVSIPSSVTVIGNGVFSGTNLTAVTLPEGLTAIGAEAFSGNRNLTAVELPAGLTAIGESVFNGCSKLTQIVIPAGVTEIPRNAFNYCTKLSNVTLPEGITTIGDYAFRNCTNLQIFNLPSTVTTIGEGAFCYCSRLDRITLPEGLTVIGKEGFYNAAISGALTLPESLKEMGEGAFDWCQNLTSVSILGAITQIPANCFRYCGGLTSIEIPQSVTSIGASAFYSCSKLETITIPASVTEIGEAAFADCNALESIHVQQGNTVYVSSDGVLFNADMTSLLQYPANKTAVSYTIPDTVTAIGSKTFYNCNNLAAVVIPGSVKSIGESAFAHCNNLADVQLGEGVKSIGEYAFSNTKIAEISLPDSLTTIGGYAFNYCVELTSVRLGANITSVDKSSFSSCEKLTAIFVDEGNTVYMSDDGVLLTKEQTSLVIFPAGKSAYMIPETVTSLPAYAFSGCANLTSIVIPGSIQVLEDSTFSSCTGLTDLTLGEGIEKLGWNAFYGCTALTEIEIPASVTTIGSGAFCGCTGLKKIHFLGDAPAIDSNAFGYEYSSDYRVSATCYYPQDNATWTEANMLDYGGTLVWMVEGTVELVDMGFCGDDLSWTLDVENKLTITGSGEMAAYNSAAKVPWHLYRDVITEVEIGEGMTALGGYAFQDMPNVTAFTLPSTLISIGENAFRGCAGLSSIVIPNAVTTIKDRAFYGCGKLQSVTMGENISFLGADVFYDTPWLAGQTDENGFTVIAGILVKYEGEAADVTLPETVRIVGSNAFYQNRQNIVSITLPNTVSILQEQAFSNCYALKSVNIPAGVTEIPNRAFYSCDALENIELHDGITRIGEYAFANDRALAEIELPQSLKSIGKNAFSGCSALKTLRIPDSVTQMGTSAFHRCTGLETLHIGAGLRLLDNYVFSQCVSLTEVEIPLNIAVIGNSAFYGCTNLSEITFSTALSVFGGVEDDWEEDEEIVYPNPGTALEINSRAFGACMGLTRVSLPSYLTKLAATAFKGSLNTEAYSVSSLNYRSDSLGVIYEIQNGTDYALVCVPAKLGGDYVISDSIQAVYADFYGCAKLTSLTFPTSVGGARGSDTFYGCTSLVSVTAGPDNDDGYYNDEVGALLWNSGDGTYVCFLPANLTEYTLGADVVSIYAGALSNVKLMAISVEEGNETYSGRDGLLYSADEAKLILYPGGKTDGCYILPLDVEEIADYAFANAEHLEQLWFTGEPFFFSESIFGAAVSETGGELLMTCYYPENVGQWGDYVMEMGYYFANSVEWCPYILLTTEIAENVLIDPAKPLAVRTRQNVSDLTGVYVDGSKAAASQYTVSENGNMVIFFEEYLNELRVGEHTIQFRFPEGNEEISTEDNLMTQKEFEEELKKAMQSGEDYCLSNAVIIDSDLTVKIPLTVSAQGSIIIADNATLVLMEQLRLKGGRITVEQGGKLVLNGDYANLTSGAQLTIAEGGTVIFQFGELYLSEGAGLHNRGTVEINENAYLISSAEVINDGTILVRGVLVNENILANNGEIAVSGELCNYGTFTGNEPVELEEPEYTVVIVGPNSVLTGKSVTLTAKILPENATGTEIVWSLADPADKSYVTLNKGRITAKRVTQARTVTIIASAEDGSALPGSFDITVVPLATSVQILWETAVGAGEDVAITYDLNNVQAGNLVLRAQTKPSGSYNDVDWTWNDGKGAYAEYAEKDDGCLVIEPKGKTGSVTITATASDGSKKAAKVTVKFVKLAQEIEITNVKDRLRGGEKLTLSTNVASDKTLTSRNVTWELVDDSEADSNAFATLSKGKLTTRVVSVPTLIKVRASVTENPAVSDTVEIMLYPAVDTVQILCDGESIANNATVTADPADGSLFFSTVFGPEGVIDEGTWTVSDKRGTYVTYAEDADGSLILTPTGKKGTVTVTMKASDGSNKSAKVKVKFASLMDDFSLSAEKISLRSGEKLQLTASEAGKFTWTSGDAAVASVSSSGKVTAKTVYAKTVVTITAQAKDGSGKTASIDLTVLPKLDETLGILCDGINVTENSCTVDIDRTESVDVAAAVYNALEDTYTYPDAVLTSSNKKVADFADGKLVIKGTGKTNITAKVSGKTVKFSLNVARYADTIQITGKTDWLLAGKNQTLKVSLTSAAGKITDKNLIWTSSDERVAVVSNKGNVTAQKIYTRETVTITASTAAGCVVGSFDMTVYPAATTVSVLDGSGRVLNNRTITAERGTVLDLSAIVYPYAGESSGAMQDVTWSISNKRAAQFNEEGQLVLLKTGTITVKVTTVDGSKKTVSFKINVVNPET